MSNGIEKFRDTIAKKNGLIIAEGPNGEVWEFRSLREAMERTGIHRSTIDYSIKHGTTPQGWKFERCK